MFVDFFYQLKDSGVPVSPTAFLILHKALSNGLISSVEDFYTAARAILIKSERYFDHFDQIFAHYFQGAKLPEVEEIQLNELASALLEEWLKNPKEIAVALGATEDELSKYTPQELIEYFKKRLKDQTKRHAGGNHWIGTGGTSPVGHSGYHPGGIRVGGSSGNKSAVKVAMERRYKDYSLSGPLTQRMVGEALKRLRNMIPAGPCDVVNVDKTIYKTMQNAGEIEIVFDQRIKDRLKVVLAIDNGGWSMDPYIDVVQTLFDHARAQFKELKIYFFHNTIYDNLWVDSSRSKQPIRVDDFARLDPQTRFIAVGDASMAPYELMAQEGSIYIQERSGRASIESLKFIANTLQHSIWLNPVPAERWHYTHTISIIGQIIPMFELSIDGLEKAVNHLMLK